MNIIYNGVDITDSVQPVTLQVTDNACGVPDSVTAAFSDTEGLWSKWKPEKNDTLQVKESGFDSGVMFVDQISQEPGLFELKALSIPQSSKTARSQGWENVRLLQMVTEIAARHGFTVQSYNIINHLYQRVDQRDEPDFAFLSDRCMLEGYALKINNRNIVLYDELKEEQKVVDQQLATIRESEINGAYRFTNKSTDIYEKCIVRSQLVNGYIEGEYTAAGISGPVLKRALNATNQAEANRWAKGLLRSFNKHMITGSFEINLNTNYAAGTNVNMVEIGMFDGKYSIHRLVHDLLRNRTKVTLRKPLEGY